MKINEISPDTVSGSFSDDLIISKIWLLHEIEKISDHFDVVYVLGSWYGNLSAMMLYKGLDIGKIVNVDTDSESLKVGEKMLKRLKISDKVENMHKDANELDYRQIKKSSLVINTSCNNIKNRGWFENIPKGTLVVLQGRNNDEGAVNTYDDLKSFSDDYPLEKTVYLKKMELEDPENRYSRYMKIGIK
jgi:SAM-dependent methyltransferase